MENYSFLKTKLAVCDELLKYVKKSNNIFHGISNTSKNVLTSAIEVVFRYLFTSFTSLLISKSVSNFSDNTKHQPYPQISLRRFHFEGFLENPAILGTLTSPRHICAEVVFALPEFLKKVMEIRVKVNFVMAYAGSHLIIVVFTK